MYLRTLLGYKLMPLSLLIIRITGLFDILLNYLYSFYSHMMMIRSEERLGDGIVMFL
jgi:hypothetical protein